MESLKRLSTVAVARLSSAAMGFGLMALTANVLGATSFGYLVAVLAYFNIAAVVGALGMESVATRIVAIGANIQGSAVSVTRVVLLWGGGACGVISGIYFWLYGDYVAIFIIMSAAFVAGTRVLQGIVRGAGLVELAGLPDGFVRPLIVAAFLFFMMVASFRVSLVEVAAAWFIGSVIVFWGTRFFVFGLKSKVVSEVDPEVVPSVDVWVLLFSVSQVLFNQFPLILLRELSGLDDVALYAVADRYAQIVQIIPQAIFLAASPALAKSWKEQSAERIRLCMARARWQAIVVALLLSAPTIIFWDRLSLAFGEGYQAGYKTLLVQLAVGVALAAFGPVTQAILMFDRPRVALFALLFGLVFQTCAGILLMPAYGAVGAAIAWGGGVIAMQVLFLCYMSSAIKKHER